MASKSKMWVEISTRIIKLEQVKIAADFLLDIMSPMFIPAAVGLILVWDDLKKVLLPVSIITLVTAILVMAATGIAAQAVIHRKKIKGDR